jgi:hypothetical protein
LISNRGPLRGVLGTRIWRTQSGGLLPGLGLGLGFDQHPHDVALLHYEVLDAIDFDLGARPLAEQDAVADFDVDRDDCVVDSSINSDGDFTPNSSWAQSKAARVLARVISISLRL